MTIKTYQPNDLARILTPQFSWANVARSHCKLNPPETALGASVFAQPPDETREPLKHLLIGSPKGVTNGIHSLHCLGYADVGAWSRLLPTGNSGEVMSILVRYIIVGG